MVGPYNTRSNDQPSSSSYAALPGTDTTKHITHNHTAMKANLAPGRDMPGCHPSRWIYELINNKFTTCDLFDRARQADLGSDYIWEHQHRLVFNGNQSFSQSSDQVLSAICIECYFHFVFKMSWEEHHSAEMCDMLQVGWPVQDDMFPWHHLVWAGSDSEPNITRDQTKYYPLLARENFVCSAPPCTFQLTLEISKPRMDPGWVKLLLDREAIRKQLDAARELEPSRYESATDDWAREAPLNLNTYLKNLLESGPEGPRSISKRNKRFAVLFGPRCYPMFRELEFKEQVMENDGIDEGSFTPTAPAPSDGPLGSTTTNTLRGYLEDVRTEVQCLIHKAGQAGERPSYCAAALHEGLRCKELSGIVNNALVDTEPYQVLGVLPGQAREIVVNAYKRQWALIPNQRRKLVDSLLSVANDSNDEALSDFAMMQSSVFDSQPQRQSAGDDDGVAFQALTFLGLEPPNNYTSEALIDGFRKKLSRDPGEAGSARSMLMVLAQGSTDDSFQTALLLESDRWMTLGTAKAVLGITGLIGSSEETLRVAKTKLAASKSREESGAYLDALDAVAKHTESRDLSDKCEDLRRLNGIPGPGDDSDTGSYLPVDFSLPVGLNNIGNTCYLNSLLQYLFTVKPIRDIVLNYDDVKLDLTDESIQQRRLGGNMMQMDRGEAVVAQAFANELATLFRNLESSNQSATRPSQRLANAVLLSTHTLLETSTQQQPSEKPTVPQAPPLPARPSPAPPAQVANDVSMADAFDDQHGTVQDNQSQASDQTLVDREEALSAGRPEKVEVIPMDGPVESDVSVAEITVDEDADMSETRQGATPNEKTSQPETGAEVARGDEKGVTDVTMTDTAEPETVDQKVLSALEHQKRSSGTDQQDVEEVMGSIINRLQAAIRPSAVDAKTGIQLEKIMETFFVTTINYTKFKDRPYQNEISFDRSITAFPAENGACSLYDALGRNFDHQILEGSGEGNDLSRYTAIKTLPPVLHVLIQRTQSSGTKNGNHVIIPETLYLDRYMDAPHDSDVFRQRREEWVTSSRIKDLKKQLLETSNPTVDFSRFGRSDASAEQGSVEFLEAASQSTTHETWDFDGPVDEEYVIVKPADKPSLFAELPSPPEDMDSLGEQIRASMEKQLEELESSLDSHLASLTEIPYHLHAVICHRGALSSGHYWVWIHDFEDKVWRWYNDAQVKENKNTAEVLNTLSTSGEPYYLCYVRDGHEDAYVNVPKRQRPEVVDEPAPAEVETTEAEGDVDAEGDVLVDDDSPPIAESKGNEKAAADTETLLDL